MCSQDVKPQAYRNAYDIPRRNLLDQLTRMRSNLLRTSQKLIRGQDEGLLFQGQDEKKTLHWSSSSLISVHFYFFGQYFTQLEVKMKEFDKYLHL